LSIDSYDEEHNSYSGYESGPVPNSSVGTFIVQEKLAFFGKGFYNGLHDNDVVAAIVGSGQSTDTPSDRTMGGSPRIS
jgi:hypothetical protein